MRVLVCQCKSAELIAPAIYETVRQSLSGRFRIVCVDDLCAMAAAKDLRLRQWAQEPLIVLACYERAIRSLFSHAGQILPESARVLNLRTVTPAEAITEKLPSGPSGGNTEFVKAANDNWPAWFPVIDYARCRNCKQCLNFCLFGVYAQTEDKKVRVARPQSCKNGCPACARVCPDAAIVFCKYDKSPINGDSVDEMAWRKSHAESTKSLKHRLSGDVYQLLHRRTDSDLKTSQDLAILREQLDIPEHVFGVNPSVLEPKRDS